MRMPPTSRRRRSGISLERERELPASVYVSADEAWEEFQEQYFGDNPELAEGFADDNPLATSDNYEVYMATTDDSMRVSLPKRAVPSRRPRKNWFSSPRAWTESAV